MSTLVIMAHMDDEALSCGGLIKTSQDVHVLTLFGRVYDYGRDTVVGTLAGEYKDYIDACNELGVTTCKAHNLDEGEPHKQSYYEMLEIIESALKKYKPTVVVIPSNDDLNQDHQLLHRICALALRPANRVGIEKILVAIGLDGTTRTPTYYLALSASIFACKLRAIDCYRRERKTGNHPRSIINIKAVHSLWGSHIDAEFAEAYTVYYMRAY